MSTQPPACTIERFRLDEARLSVHLIAEDEPFGIRGDDERGFAAAIVTRFEDAIEAKAIIGPSGLEPIVYAIGLDSLLVAIRPSEAAALPSRPTCQLATYSFETAAIACRGDESFKERCAVIEVLLGYANKLVLPFAVLCRIEEALRGS